MSRLIASPPTPQEQLAPSAVLPGPDPSAPTSAEQRKLFHQRLRQISSPTLLRFLLAVAGDWAVIVGAIVLACALGHPVAYVLAAYVIGTRQNALGVLGHEGAHWLATRRKPLNDLISNVLCWWPLFGDLASYRKFHFAHHHDLGTAADPELAFKKVAAPQWDLPTTRRRILIYVCLDLLGLGLLGTLGVILTLRPRRVGGVVGLLLWWSVAISVLWWCGWLWPVLGIWVGALATSAWAGFRLRVWTEHAGTADTHRISATWWQRWLFLPHNTWYHDEHHRWPSVPCSRLPEVRALDAETPVITVAELFRSFDQHKPVRSGEVLKESAPAV